MRRVSTDMPNTDAQYYLRRHEENLSNIQSKIAGNTRIRELRDDPLAASHAVRYESYLARLERFEENTLYAQDHYNEVDSYLRQANEALQRIRELSVQGANGIYTKEDLKYMAVEVNELLKELISLSNAVGSDGKQLFAGDKAFTEPFRQVEGAIEGGDERMVVRVEYRGAGSARRTELTDHTYSDLDIGGGEAFWAEKMQIFSTIDATSYRAERAGAFYVDGVEIPVAPGDTAQTIVAKINESPAPVKAYMDIQTKGLALEGTNAHLIRMEDRQDSRILQDLGIVSFNNDPSAPNWHPAAKVSGGSAFDMVIRLRDALFRGDQDFVGSQGIGGIDLALSNIQSRIAVIGSREERAEMTWKRLNEEIPQVAAALARESSLDFATAATDLSMMQFAHKAALQTAAKIIPSTLLDFLR
ncbi:MAG: flagellar hook-associated protein 3 [Treponema sp.]|jgi:flagellar hook-associated protein 3 FlgL|nr:flagellar hook-associated protein 3 [Treponema sp.]